MLLSLIRLMWLSHLQLDGGSSSPEATLLHRLFPAAPGRLDICRRSLLPSQGDPTQSVILILHSLRALSDIGGKSCNCVGSSCYLPLANPSIPPNICDDTFLVFSASQPTLPSLSVPQRCFTGLQPLPPSHTLLCWSQAVAPHRAEPGRDVSWASGLHTHPPCWHLTLRVPTLIFPSDFLSWMKEPFSYETQPQCRLWIPLSLIPSLPI